MFSSTSIVPRVLFVDDDVQLLAGLSRTLGRHFDLHTETDASRALTRLKEDESYAVVVSDMQMPQMEGTRFLKEARSIAPKTVRMLITGHASLPTALAAVNDGFVFRLLVKPLPPLALVTMVSDAVEQHRALCADRLMLEQKIDVISTQLLHSERLATLGTLACGVGHELNNVTSVFFGVLEGLREAVAAGTPPLPEDVEDLAHVARHLKAHGRQLLDMGRPTQDCPEPLDLMDVVSKTLGMLLTAGKTRWVDVEVRSPQEEVVVLARRTQVEQVLVNLVINAVDAMNEVKGRPQRLTLSIERRERFAACSVTDSGAGMPPEVQARIFEAFFTTKPRERGTGLGLPVVRQIVESHGGMLSVSSKVGEGTTFLFTLPLAPD
jgi:signal transduction histidine kinase